MKTRRHLSIDINGILARYGKKSMKGLFSHEDGRKATDKESRQYLAECLAKGWKLIPVSECEGFDHFGGGCPGHPIEEDTE